MPKISKKLIITKINLKNNRFIDKDSGEKILNSIDSI